jgi:hypothetical protein
MANSRASAHHCRRPPLGRADASDNNTVDIAGLPPGQHKMKIELVDANHEVSPGQVVTLTFSVPGPAK